jgi:hypothetical protein
MFRILLLFIAMNACATERPQVLKQFMDNNETAGYVTVVKNLTTEEKAFFWKNTKTDEDGILIRTNPLDKDLTSTERMFGNSKKTVDKSSKVFKHIAKTFDMATIVGEFRESEYHRNYFIKVPAGTAKLTILDLAAEDYKVTVIADFLNTKIRDSKASLILLNGDKLSSKRIWVLSWHKNNIQYDFELPDEIQLNGKTKLTKDDVINFATKITNP